jgi:uncharacterized protein YdeI (YjbR/CyaY-like superfamily)
MATDPRIDAYIAKAAPFAQPIIAHLRALVRRVVPEAVETVKWGMPHFCYKEKNLAGIGAFKAHVAFTLHGQGRQGKEADGMGQYGKIASLADLPDDAELTTNILYGKTAIDNPVPKARSKPAPKPEIAMPDDFAAELARLQGARERFDAFAPSHRREYLEWIVAAKRPETRARRIATACEWIAEGKKRNWKYQNC